MVGWREYVDLPDWGLEMIVAKVDTGARSSAIDVASVEEIEGGRVRFQVVVDRKRRRRKTLEADIVRRTRVRSSFGKSHERFFVETTIELAGRRLAAEIGLVNRRSMLCRMLLGRKSLEGAFVVDPSRAYIHGKRSVRKRRKKTKT
jgi:hypothetical protein